MPKHTPAFVDRPEQAARELSAIASVKEIALDTEGASFHRYVDRIYLLQLSTRDRSMILDPLTLNNDTLAPLGALLENPSVETVLHDADYDLRLLYQDYAWHVRNIFDTRVASQLLGLKSFGLAALLERYFGVKLDKKHQRADWSMRPLTQDMLDYAAQDTMNLLELRDQLRDELAKKGRLEWAREEFARLEGTRWADENPGEAFLKVKGARDLTRRELAILRELHPWRENVARSMDRATFRVIGNEQLLDISRLQPRGKDDLLAIKGVPRGLVENRAREIIDAVQRGLAVPEDALPRFPKGPRWDRDPQFDTRVSALKNVRDEAAQRLDMDPGVLASRERLEAVARAKPKSVDDLAAIPGLRRWQIDVMGADFVKSQERI